MRMGHHPFSLLCSLSSACCLQLYLQSQLIQSCHGWVRPPTFSQRHSSLLQVKPDSDTASLGSSSPLFQPTPVTVSKPTRTPLRELYPPSEAVANGTLQVDTLHKLYYEIHGSSNRNSDSVGAQRKKSALFLHGGPGSGCTPTHARFFDPMQYDPIVLLDQRGCGQSTPRALVENNTLLHLVDDCEALRKHLQLEQWDVVLGGSWGSTLALAYAQEYPTAVKSIVLRGVCCLRTGEVDWLFTPQGKPAAQMNPKAWDAFQEAVGLGGNLQSDGSQQQQQQSETSTSDSSMADRTVLHAYYDRMFGINTTNRWNAARSWMMYEYAISQSFKQGNSNDSATTESSPAVLVSESNANQWVYQDRHGNNLPPEGETELLDSPEEASVHLKRGLPGSESPPSVEKEPAVVTKARPIGMSTEDVIHAQDEQFGNYSGLPAMAMLTCYYSVNNQYAMNNVDLLSPARIDRIRHIPCIALQGGNDPICPPDTALELKELWPELELRIPLLAGHSMYHPELTHEIVQATDRLATL